MSKITVATLVVALTTFSIYPMTPPTKSEPLSQQGKTKVMVYFSGLMVFHKPQGKPGYEVGILDDANHEFKVSVGSISIPLPTGSSWTLEIKNPGSTSPTVPYEVGHDRKRRPDHPDGRWDFSWIIDLEKEFHPGSKFELIPGKLKPIIQLPGGRFHTEYKSMDLLRWQGPDDKKASLFGFVPETIVLQFDLSSTQKLVIKNGAGDETTLVEPSSGPSEAYVIHITNHPSELNDVSDFHLYYQLFKNPPSPNLQYSFKANKDPSTQLHPYNPLPGFHKDTCCAMVCTAVLLGESKNDLR